MTQYTHVVLERLTGKEIKVGPHNSAKYRNAIEFIRLHKPVPRDSDSPLVKPKRKVARPTKASRTK